MMPAKGEFDGGGDGVAEKMNNTENLFIVYARSKQVQYETV